MGRWLPAACDGRVRRFTDCSGDGVECGAQQVTPFRRRSDRRLAGPRLGVDHLFGMCEVVLVAPDALAIQRVHLVEGSLDPPSRRAVTSARPVAAATAAAACRYIASRWSSPADPSWSYVTRIR